MFHGHGVYGQAAISLLTAQNSLGVQAVWAVEPAQIGAQIAALSDDMPPDAIKTGALASPDAVTCIGRAVSDAVSVRGVPLVIDPVLKPTRGAEFAAGDLVSALRAQLIPLAALVTPNLEEASILTGIDVRCRATALEAARALCVMGARAALVKGGHFEGDPLDVLFLADGDVHYFQEPRIVTQHTHGTGCALSAAITARLALGYGLVDAVMASRSWLRRALSECLGLGGGRGPINHFVRADMED